MLIIKLVWMYVIAMCTAAFIYPLLRELGHFLAALLVGADVVEMAIFPTPYVSVVVESYDFLGQAVIGMCGMIFPMICTMLRPKRFVSSIVVSIISFINALAWLLSCAAIVANRLGFYWKNEDAITVIRSIEDAETLVFFFCSAAFIISFCALFKRGNIRRIMAFFNKKRYCLLKTIPSYTYILRRTMTSTYTIIFRLIITLLYFFVKEVGH